MTSTNSPVNSGHQPSVLVRAIRQRQGFPVAGATLEEAFAAALAIDVTAINEPLIISPMEATDKLQMLDFDKPDGEPSLDDTELSLLFPSDLPQPRWAWRTHGGGLRVVFVAHGNFTARELAGAWLLYSPLGRLKRWSLELKTDTRHPAGLRNGLACGSIVQPGPSSQLRFPQTEGAVDAKDVADHLARIGLGFGRHPHASCLWDPTPTSGNAPVVLTPECATCFKCGRRQPWSWILGTPGLYPPLVVSARAFVHLPHQKHVLRALYPHLPEALFEATWRACLRFANQERLADAEQAENVQARIDAASSPHRLKIARAASGAWIHSASLLVRIASPQRTLAFLPWAISPPDVDEASGSGSLHGFVPVQPLGTDEVLPPLVEAPPGSVFARRPREPHAPPPPDLSRRPSSTEVDDARAIVAAFLPGIDLGYVEGLIIASFVAKRGVGTWPILCVVGQSGSAKTALIALAAGMIGTKATAVAFGSNDDATRKIGLALEEGAGLVFIDEVGREDALHAKLGPLLAANSTLTFRAKYANERSAPIRAALVLLGSTMPPAIVQSPEIARRAVAYRLSGAEKKWQLFEPRTGAPLDFTRCRAVDGLRPSLDVIVAALWWQVADEGPAIDWRRLLVEHHDALHLGDLDLVVDRAARDAAIRDLYEAFRSTDASELSAADGWAGWLIADEGTKAGKHVGVLIDANAPRPVWHGQSSDLERLNLAPILGFANPQLQLLVRQRGARVLVKFVEFAKAKGRGTPREKLPPLGDNATPPNGDDEEVRL